MKMKMKRRRCSEYILIVSYNQSLFTETLQLVYYVGLFAKHRHVYRLRAHYFAYFINSAPESIPAGYFYKLLMNPWLTTRG